MEQEHTSKGVHEAMLEYHHVFSKQIKFLLPESQLSNFYRLLEIQKNVEISSDRWKGQRGLLRA